MKNEMAFKDSRLLESLEYIDRELIAEAVEGLKLPDGQQHASAGRRRTLAYSVALAACLILLSMAFPVVTRFVSSIGDFFAGRGSGTTEVLTDTINSESIDSELYITHSLTQDDVDNVNSAHKKYWKYNEGVFWNSLEEVTFAKGERCTYGKYNDCIIIAKRTEMDFVDTIIVNEHEFILPACFLWVCKDGEFYDLSTAYNNGWLNDEAIKCIYDIHNNYIWGHLTENDK